MLTTVSSPQIKSAILLDTEDASWLRELAVLAPIVLVYLILALYRIDHQSFWTDEVASLKAASPEASFFSKAIWYNGQGPLYFALLHIWMLAGHSELVVRSLSTFLGAASLCLTYAVGLRLVNRKLAVVGALLLATSPFFIWYSQETRYITLAIATSLLSMYSFHGALSTGSFRSWLTYAVATTIALFSFVPNAFLVFAQGLYLLLSQRSRASLGKWLAWQTAVGLIFGTWLLISYGGLSIVTAPETRGRDIKLDPTPLETGTPRELSAAVIPYTFFAFSSGFSIGPSVEELHLSRELPVLLKDLPSLAPLALFFGALSVVGGIELYRKTDVAVLFLLWLVIPIAGVVMVAATTNVAYNVRYACAALPAYIFILAAAITTFRKQAVKLAVLAAVLSVNGLSLANNYFDARYAKADSRDAARYLESAAHPRDRILGVGNMAAFSYYYKGGSPYTLIDARRKSELVLVEDLRQLAEDHDRLWLVEIRSWETDPQGKIKAALDNLAHRSEHKKFPGVELYSYQAARQHDGKISHRGGTEDAK
jgi:4-amino-4-deoxy-L-arabinose transferase-like glycosyltransferase